MKNLVEHIGIEPERLQFSWISSSEAPKFAEVATEVIEAVRKVGPVTKLLKTRAEVVS